ncbi:uncharacterized protein LOC128951746 [Oppia nitens]|uniref:uncharacterized protein LOC128951746 n=1 Tax=Oppia nitens TaxID=1686743 RepID=UPI0023DC6C0A|nr:uncharacterized protein LOC128951746 [Oppia nitens]
MPSTNNRLSNGAHPPLSPHISPSSRLMASTISSLAKQKALSRWDTSDSGLSTSTNGTGAGHEVIMRRTTNLTRTRSLRLPQRSRNYMTTSSYDRSHDVSPTNSSVDDSRVSELEKKLKQCELKIKELESDIKESKETIEFLTSERTILADSLKETEDTLYRVNRENSSLKKSIDVKEEMIDKLGSKYSRNRKVWEENEVKANEEIKKLDEMIDHVIDTLKSLPDCHKNCESIEHLLYMLTDDNKQQTVV